MEKWYQFTNGLLWLQIRYAGLFHYFSPSIKLLELILHNTSPTSLLWLNQLLKFPLLKEANVTALLQGSETITTVFLHGIVQIL